MQRGFFFFLQNTLKLCLSKELRQPNRVSLPTKILSLELVMQYSKTKYNIILQEMYELERACVKIIFLELDCTIDKTNSSCF